MTVPSAGRLPVVVLTGFLGSGKTSLLRRLLQAPELADAAVLINEFGEVGLDHWLLERLDGDTVLLPSGCVCCTIRSDLRDALLDLHERRARGLLPPFRRIVIETTGLADPAPIAQTIHADPRLRYHLALGNIVTVVDAVNGADTLDRFEAAVHQAAVADRLVLSKTDLADASTVAALERRLAVLNPTASRLRLAPAAAVPASLLTEDLLDPDGRAAHVARWLDAGDGHDHDHNAGVRSLALVREAPLDWARFAVWFSMLLNRHGRNLLRAKGILHVDGVPTPVVVHGVQHVLHPPSHLAAWPGDRPVTRLVLIGRDLDPALLRRSFEAFMGAVPVPASTGAVLPA
ncbi:MAG: GTP-binding protein [Geminicoccaceae bacterium]